MALFSEVLRDFRIDPAEIEMHETEVRRGGYAALLERSAAAVDTGAAPEAPAPANPGFRGVDTETTIQFTPAVGPEKCSHLGMIRPVRPSARGCEDCLRSGDTWVHLRVCLTCGHAGCCDSSKNRHARAHWKAAGHPLMRSLQPGESWAWCFEDETNVG